MAGEKAPEGCPEAPFAASRPLAYAGGRFLWSGLVPASSGHEGTDEPGFVSAGEHRFHNRGRCPGTPPAAGTSRTWLWEQNLFTPAAIGTFRKGVLTEDQCPDSTYRTAPKGSEPPGPAASSADTL